VADYGRHALTK